MNELALFAGAGGGILGGNLLGWRTVCAVEIDTYCISVLLQRQNDGILPPFPVWDDIRTFDGRPWRGIVDVVSGGFPCQDISAAGNGAGITGERSGLWKEMARVVGEVRPQYVLVENSPLLTSRGLGTVLGDLAAMGYDAEWGVFSACSIGAPHTRERMFILAYSWTLGRDKECRVHFGADTETSRLQEARIQDDLRLLVERDGSKRCADGVRISDVMADELDPIKALGNGQVPAVVRLAWETLMSEPCPKVGKG